MKYVRALARYCTHVCIFTHVATVYLHDFHGLDIKKCLMATIANPNLFNGIFHDWAHE